MLNRSRVGRFVSLLSLPWFIPFAAMKPDRMLAVRSRRAAPWAAKTRVEARLSVANRHRDGLAGP